MSGQRAETPRQLPRGRVAASAAAASALLAWSVASPACAQDGVPAEDRRFQESELLAGSHKTRAQCDARAGALWAVFGDEEACLAVWLSSPHAAGQRAALVYFTGDAISGLRAQPAYVQRTPRQMQAYVDERAALLGVPVVLLARPGTYGSSGDHRQRRREPESRLVSTALDELKRRLGLHTLALAGFSGGGHVVAALLGWRSDVPCAALGSAVSSPRLRWQALGLTRDMTGFTDSYEPAQHLGSARLAGARVYIVGDPRDRNTPWSTQLPFGERLRERGAEVRVVETEGHGPEHHDVSAEAQRLAAACLRERLEAAGPVGAPPPR